MSAGRAMRMTVALVFVALLGSGLPGSARAVELPGPPRNVTAAAGDDLVVLTWLPPLDDGGSPITGYAFAHYTQGVLYYFSDVLGPETTRALGPDQYVLNTLDVQFGVFAVTDAGMGGMSELSNIVSVREGAVAPQVVLSEIPPDGGVVSTDPVGTQPSASNPVVTSVAVPPTLGGGTLSISETHLTEAPSGFTFLGQDIVIESTAATDAENPLEIVFGVDPALVPVTIFRNGVPVTAACDAPGIASPSPCIASGAGTAEITILTAAASTWNAGIAAYAFGGFSSPVDNAPTINVAKAGRAIPVRFGLGGDQGLNVFAPGHPRSREVACDAGGSTDGIEETVPSASTLSFSPGTGRYQLGWNTDRSWTGTCRELILRFRDGSQARATFAFR